MLLDFRYEMRLEFSEPVEDQHFAFRCIPMNTARQKLIALETSVQPETRILTDQDGLGSRRLYGLVKARHDEFCLAVSGQVETNAEVYEEYEDPSSVELVRWLVPSEMTVPGDRITELYRDAAGRMPDDIYGRMICLKEAAEQAIIYEPGITDVRTTAEQALRLGRGVCQDYAHLLTALLRLAGIPARYAAGLIPGEGESHAWVEACCSGWWYGVDPTNRLLVDDRYIKFSHGRDYRDCMVSMGIFRNPRAVQDMKISASVREVNEAG